jgi:hypothetical protein
LAERAIAEQWGQAEVRRAMAERKVTLQPRPPAAGLATRVRELASELERLDVSALGSVELAELGRLYQRLALLVTN